ncbi:hypothetical protein DBV15_10411 [Temnothorax longispinosus]|uniref:Uncharacterized protein n=1 Tax=Temnothorax longispinosus TaxID=300112 RepID=A0A4S2L3H2_9HYME|nr:hypothetical protein DBV15_10411 [Temnothorax longispinosus]
MPRHTTFPMKRRLGNSGEDATHPRALIALLVEGLCARGMFARRSLAGEGRSTLKAHGEGMGCATRSRTDREIVTTVYEKGKCGSERRCGTELREGVPKRGRDAHPVARRG